MATKVGGSSTTTVTPHVNVVGGVATPTSSSPNASALATLSLLGVGTLGSGTSIYGGKSYDGSTINIKSIKGINGTQITSDANSIYISGGSSSGGGASITRMVSGASDTPTLSDSGGTIFYNSTVPVTVTVNDLGTLTNYSIVQLGTGAVTLIPGSNTTLLNNGNILTNYSTTYQGAIVKVTSTGLNLAFINGDGNSVTGASQLYDNATGDTLVDDVTQSYLVLG